MRNIHKKINLNREVWSKSKKSDLNQKNRIFWFLFKKLRFISTLRTAEWRRKKMRRSALIKLSLIRAEQDLRRWKSSEIISRTLNTVGQYSRAVIKPLKQFWNNFRQVSTRWNKTVSDGRRQMLKQFWNNFISHVTMALDRRTHWDRSTDIPAVWHLTSWQPYSYMTKSLENLTMRTEQRGIPSRAKNDPVPLPASSCLGW